MEHLPFTAMCTLENVRTFMNFDFIYRSLKHLGYDVRYVRNITDAGHLTDDGDVNNDRLW